MKFMVKKILDSFKDGAIFDFDDSEIFILDEHDNPYIRICKSQRRDAEFTVMVIDGRIKITPDSGNTIFLESTRRME